MVKKILLPLLILVFFSAVAVAMYMARPKAEKVEIEPPSFFVEVAEARKSLVNFKVESQGSVAPRTETTLIAEASGQIIEVSNAFVSGIGASSSFVPIESLGQSFFAIPLR